MFRHILSHKISASLIGFGLVAIATVAVADTSNLPASTCVAAEGGALFVRTDGQVENRSAGTVTAVCPVERKRVEGGGLAKKFSAHVFAVDQHSKDNVCCKVVSKNPAGAVKTGEEVCSNGDSGANQQLVLPELNDRFTWSHFFVQCTLPAHEGEASRLMTIRSIQE